MADAGVIDFDPDFVGLWRGNFNILNGKIFSRLPGNRRLCTISMAIAMHEYRR